MWTFYLYVASPGKVYRMPDTQISLLHPVENALNVIHTCGPTDWDAAVDLQEHLQEFNDSLLKLLGIEIPRVV